MKYVSAPRRRSALRGFIVAAMATMTFFAWTAVAYADHEKVTVCHATGSASNPYVETTVAFSAAFGPAGHFNEDGSPVSGHEADFVLVRPGESIPHGVPVSLVQIGTSCESAAVTAATFRSATATKAPGSVLLRWKTGAEVSVLGYNVYIERNGKRVKANSSLIAGKGVTGGNYAFRYKVPKGKKAPSRFWIQTVDVDGTRSWRSVRAS